MGTLRNFYSRQKQGEIKYENPGVARHFPVLLAGLLGVGEGAGTYTGSVGGSLIHLEAHFESLDFYFIGSEFVSSFSVLATRMTCRVLDRA